MEKYEESHVSYCNKCKRHFYPNSTNPYMLTICPDCGEELEDTGKTETELYAERPTAKELIGRRLKELKETDPAKYEIAVAKYKEKLAREASEKKAAQINIPKCPICGSTNLTKLSTVGKIAKIAAFGIFGMGDNGKTYKCNSCGAKF